MKYKLSIRCDEVVWSMWPMTPVWDHFCRDLQIIAHSKNVLIQDIVNDELDKAGGELAGGDIIEFESEEDATAFILKYS